MRLRRGVVRADGLSGVGGDCGASGAAAGECVRVCADYARGVLLAVSVFVCRLHEGAAAGVASGAAEAPEGRAAVVAAGYWGGLPRAARGYGPDWDRLRNWFIRQPENVECFDCLAAGRHRLAADVDHIVPFTSVEDPARLDPTNLRALCRACHRRKHKRWVERVRCF